MFKKHKKCIGSHVENRGLQNRGLLQVWSFRWNTVKVSRSYANECKKETIVDVEIPMGLGHRNSVHRNFGVLITSIQMDSLGKNPMVGTIQHSYENPSIQIGPEYGTIIGFRVLVQCIIGVN